MQSFRFSCQVLMKLEFSGQIFGNAQPNFMKIDPVRAELFRTNGWRGGHDEANGHLSKFGERA
jgi:hypothetical protein